MNLDDLLKSVREGEILSPKDVAGHKKKISSEKFFNIAQELRTEGTIKGQQVTPTERKEGFKKSEDPVQFKVFVENVLAKKSGGGGTNILPGNSVGTPGQKLLPGSVSSPEAETSDIKPEDKQKREKSLLTFVKQINNRVGGILRILDKRSDVEEDAAQEKSQEAEKDTRAAKEAGAEKKAGIGKKLLGPIQKMAEPVTNLWDKIIKTIGALLIGWGLDKFIKWLQNPDNKQAVDDFKDFVAVAVPAILKGILAVVGYNLVKNLIKFTAGLVAGAAKLLIFLGKMAINLGKLAWKNKSLALALGLGAMTGIAITHMAKKGADDLKEGTQPGKKEDEALDVEEKVNKGKIPPKTETNVKASGGGLIPNLMGGTPGTPGGDGQPGTLDQPGGEEFVYSLRKFTTRKIARGDEVERTKTREKTQGAIQLEDLYANQDQILSQLPEGTTIESIVRGTSGIDPQVLFPILKSSDAQAASSAKERARTMQMMQDTNLINPDNTVKGHSWFNKEFNGGGLVQHFKRGGRVKNQGGKTSPEAEGTDTVPAMLTPGEFVMSRGAVNKWGINTLENMNAAAGGTNKPKITQKVYARGGGRVPMIYARGGGLADGWSTSKTVNKPSIFDRVRGAVGSAASSVKQFLKGGGKSADANQLVSSPPSAGGKGTIIPVPITKKPTTVPGPSPSSAAPEQPFFSPVDQENFSSLITKSMYNILE